MSKATELRKFIVDNPTLSSTVIGEKFGTSDRYVRKLRSTMKIEGKIQGNTIPKTIDQEILERRRLAQIKDLQKRNSEILIRYEKLQEQYDNVLMLQEVTDVDIPTIDINPTITSHAVPIIQFSDWHLEEKVEKSTTHGLNEYNPTVAHRRVKKVTQNTLKLIEKERQDVKIDSLVICLGGDFINNYLHDHDTQMNFMSPIEASIFAKEMVKEALSTIAEYAKVKKIIVVCVRGNHGRLTKRMQSSNDYKMNLEAVIYYMLKQELNDPVFEWHIPESEHAYIQVFGKTIRAFHGHQVNFQGGVGDITIPVNKAIMKWDKTKKADWNLMHHFHRFWMPTHNTSLNGSLVGWNSYALSIGAQYEPPTQAFHLLDAKRGFTVRTPIQCE